MFSSPPGLTGSALIAGLAGVLLVPLGAPAQAAEVDLEARTHSTSAFPNARGHAGYERDGGGREPHPGLAGVRAPAGHRVTVRVHGALVGRTTVGAAGRAHLERHSGVPGMSAGDVVRVRTAGDRLVTCGSLHRDHD